MKIPAEAGWPALHCWLGMGRDPPLVYVEKPGYPLELVLSLAEGRV
jgi:hypothetical protein